MTQKEIETLKLIAVVCKINRPPNERLDLIREYAEKLLKFHEEIFF